MECVGIGDSVQYFAVGLVLLLSNNVTLLLQELQKESRRPLQPKAVPPHLIFEELKRRYVDETELHRLKYVFENATPGLPNKDATFRNVQEKADAVFDKISKNVQDRVTAVYSDPRYMEVFRDICDV